MLLSSLAFSWIHSSWAANEESVPRVVAVGFPWTQNGAFEVAVMDGVWQELRLQADGPKFFPICPFPAPPCTRTRAGHIVPSEHLQAGLVCPHLHCHTVRSKKRSCEVSPAFLRRLQNIIDINRSAFINRILQKRSPTQI